MVSALSDHSEAETAEPIPFPARPRARDENPIASTELEAVIVAVANGDTPAFERLYRLTSRRLMTIAQHFLGDRDEAEDVLHDVYLTVWNKAGSYRAGQSRPVAWLTAITRNRCLDRLRLRTKRPQAAPEVLATLPDDTADVLAKVQQEENGRRLLLCMDNLAEDQRFAVRTAFYGGQTYEAIASALSIPLPTLKSRIRRALQLMRQCLQP